MMAGVAAVVVASSLHTIPTSVVAAQATAPPRRGEAAASDGDRRARPREPAATLAVELVLPGRIALGDRGMAMVTVRVQGDGSLPLLLTPSAEGTALEVVRGRLLGSDAASAVAGPEGTTLLSFQVPFVARRAGAAVLKVRVLGYACSHRCRAIEVETRRMVTVATPATEP